MTKQEINKMFYDNCKEYNLYSLQLCYDKNTKNYVLDEKSHKEDEMIFKQSGLDNLVSQLLTLIEQEKKKMAQEMLNDLKGLLEGYIHTNENITLYEYYCKKYGVEL